MAPSERYLMDFLNEYAPVAEESDEALAHEYGIVGSEVVILEGAIGNGEDYAGEVAYIDALRRVENEWVYLLSVGRTQFWCRQHDVEPA